MGRANLINVIFLSIVSVFSLNAGRLFADEMVPIPDDFSFNEIPLTTVFRFKKDLEIVGKSNQANYVDRDRISAFASSYPVEEASFLPFCILEYAASPIRRTIPSTLNFILQEYTTAETNEPAKDPCVELGDLDSDLASAVSATRFKLVSETGVELVLRCGALAKVRNDNFLCDSPDLKVSLLKELFELTVESDKLQTVF